MSNGMSEVLKNNLSDLLFDGSISRKFKVGRHVFEIALLTASEEEEVSAVAGRFDVFTRERILRRQTIIKATITLDGKEFDKEAKEEIFGTFQYEFIDKLYQSLYLTLKKEVLEKREDLFKELKNSSGSQEAETSGN